MKARYLTILIMLLGCGSIQQLTQGERNKTALDNPNAEGLIEEGATEQIMVPVEDVVDLKLSESLALSLSPTMTAQGDGVEEQNAGSIILLANREISKVHQCIQAGIAEISDELVDLGRELCFVESLGAQVKIGGKYAFTLKSDQLAIDVGALNPALTGTVINFPDSNYQDDSSSQEVSNSDDNNVNQDVRIKLWIAQEEDKIVMRICRNSDVMTHKLVVLGLNEKGTAGKFMRHVHGESISGRWDYHYTDEDRHRMTMKKSYANRIYNRTALSISKNDVSRVATYHWFKGESMLNPVEYSTFGAFGPNLASYLFHNFQKNETYRGFVDNAGQYIDSSFSPEFKEGGKLYSNAKLLPKPLERDFAVAPFKEWDCSGTEEIELSVSEEQKNACQNLGTKLNRKITDPLACGRQAHDQVAPISSTNDFKSYETEQRESFIK